ncbi:hypothetical protein [Corynebacterium gerontici]|uniref:Uncharacterized protein n=1 Tax=Corynebacterium gerontici TaxID=2079234 RepID=A0A3G6J0F4_9CORY|nr:hypothetical protein [Corynebacterium gerontici]AZA11432.1 hypothetical protein CGERO_05620 [Corynebacterium gerontici]
MNAQAMIDEFLADLEEFATGAYLKPEEKEFWEPPFDPEAIPELRRLLERFSASVDSKHFGEQVGALEAALDEFNSKHFDAVIEPEEHEELNQLIANIAEIHGVDLAKVSQFPMFQDDED